MNKKTSLLPFLLLISSFVMFACIALIPLQQEPVTGTFGPQTSPQEQQTRTFETLWQDLKDNYIYYDTADVDWTALHDKYLARIQAGLSAEQFSALIKELETDLPDGSFLYQTRAERIQSDTSDASSYEGIGAFVGFSKEPEPHIVLLAVIQGSPAEKAGLQAHDSILAIDGNPVLLDEGLAAVDRVRGPAGSSVTLSIQSPGTSERSVEVKRGKLTSTGKLEAHRIGGTSYGYLLFPPVGYDALQAEVLQALQDFTTNQKLGGLILDLRIASSSRGWPLEALYTMFDNGVMGEFYNRHDKQSVKITGQDTFNSQKIPLVILAGQNTTGVPEIFAASLQADKRATVIGERTPGAIETTSSYYLPDGSQAFIATTSFMLPSGAKIGNTGVIPDVAVNAGWDEVLPEKDPVLDRAVEYLDKQP